MTPSPGGAYRVVTSQRVLDQLREWARQAERLGMNQEYLAILRTVWRTEFHVTLARSGENLHFYYHEHDDNEWVPGGHTSGGEIARLGLSPAGLRAQADGVASALASALGGTCRARDEGGR